MMTASACASLWGFEDLKAAGDDASATDDGGNGATGPDGAFQADGTVDGDASFAPDRADSGALMDVPDQDVRMDRDEQGCVPSQTIALDVKNRTTAVSPSRIEDYVFVVQPAGDVIVRVRTGGNIADVTVSTQCDGKGAVMPLPLAATGGLYTRGTLPAGAYHLHIAWDPSVQPGSQYSFDVMRSSPASNASCSRATALALGTSLTGDSFAATDTTTGCQPAMGYGQLFYSVQVPPNAGWQITATPNTTSWAPWTVVLAASATCTDTTCTPGGTARSSAAGAPASITLNNPTPSPKSYIIGASASLDDAVTGGGTFSWAATALAQCLSSPCDNAGGICCSSLCQPPSPQNSCGMRCNVSCPVNGEVCCNKGASSTCCCPNSQAAICNNNCTDINSNVANCGACGVHCTSNDPNASALTCVNQKCGWRCRTGTRHCPNRIDALCTDVNTDVNNCGACGNVCPTDPNGARSCVNGACVITCTTAGFTLCGSGPGKCVDLTRDTSNCGTCAHACATDPHGAVACTAGMCVPQCNGPQYQLCTGAFPCQNTQTDVNHCGNCATACMTDPHGTASCAAGQCHLVCNVGYLLCGGICVPNDNSNCGACGNVCPAAETCQGGTCKCPTPAAPDYCALAAICTNLQTDNTHCGTCATNCTLPETCQGGTCKCPMPSAPDYCPPVCTNLQTDNANCGTCSIPCPAAETCQAGICKCPTLAAPDYCPALGCTSLQTDVMNCGICGNMCPTPDGGGAPSCVGGACQ
jgi:hypothetical protein